MRNKIPSDRERLDHILEAIDSIDRFTHNLTEEEFLLDDKAQSSVLYQFVIIGEAVASLTMNITDRFAYPWHKPRAFRNFIAHEYFGVKMWMVWKAIKIQLPELKQHVFEIIHAEFEEKRSNS